MRQGRTKAEKETRKRNRCTLMCRGRACDHSMGWKHNLDQAAFWAWVSVDVAMAAMVATMGTAATTRVPVWEQTAF